MRPAVLIVDPDDDRRHALAHGLAEYGYEAIPAGSSQEGLKFAQGLGPSVIVGPSELPAFSDGAILRQSSGQDGSKMQRTLVLLGAESEAPDELSDDIYYLPRSGFDHEELVQRIRLLLVGREVGIEPDLELRYLVGDLALTPLLDLVRSLSRSRVTGTVEVKDGQISCDRGNPVFARFGKTVGAKAFCRVARLQSAPFRVRVMRPGDDLQVGRSNLEEDLDTLSIWALDESHLEIPDLRSRVRLVALRDIPSGELTPHEKLLATAIHRCETLGEVLDGLAATDGLLVKAVLKMVDRGALVLERPKTQVRIVTDSTSDLPPSIAREHDILIVPLTVVFGKDALRDGVDILARDFYKMLRDNEHHPRTEPPDEAVFFEHYHDLIVDQDILSVHISAKLSKTLEHAQQAALRGIRSFDHLPPERHSCALEVVDTCSVSMGVGMQALFASRMALRGEKVFAIAQRLRDFSSRTHLLFGVDSLDYLVKGGRIGKARALVGKLLGIKPILGVVDGEVTAVDRARGGRRVHPRIIQLLSERIDPKKPIVVCVAHAEAPVWADRLRRLIEKTFKVHEILLADIGPVVGTHAGPGCVGTVVFQPTDEEWQLIRPVE